MTEPYHKTVIALGNLKDALLHFEYVIPMNIAGQFMGFRISGETGENLVEKVGTPGMHEVRDLFEVTQKTDNLRSVYPPHLRENQQFKSALNIFDGLLFMHTVKTLEGEDTFQKYLAHLSETTGSKAKIDPNKVQVSAEDLRKIFRKIVSDFKLDDLPVDCSKFALASNEDAEPSNAVKVPVIRAIDTDKVSVAQIIMLREDKEIMKKMRRFRLFAYEQYVGKDKEYIEDDLQIRLSDYLQAVKSSGFETTTKSLSFLFESKFLLGAFATSAISLLFGDTKVAIGAFSAGTVIEVGKMSLEYFRQKHALAEMCRGNPVSYLSDVRQRLSPEPKVDSL